MTEKPAILQESTFVVEEGLAYRVCRTGAIWTNKLFFSCLVLLAVWLLLAYVGGLEACTDGGAGSTCSAFLTPTAKYLGAMAILSFLLSLAFGALGLAVGKRVLEMTPSKDEVGAGAVRGEEHGAPSQVPERGP